MSVQTAIQVEKLSKRYRIGIAPERYRTIRDAITGAFRSIGNRSERQKDSTFWALRDVSFNIEQGEVVGIIGRNGAGKSTLLKILSRITEPTEGRVAIRGRAGSLLEVGTGFHPELSGRENIFLNGAILGMRRDEIARQFDAIVDFAEIGQFLDTPVKRYSSGMYVRLAFAVAAHLDPEILIVDEVLAVGDASFQKKCLGKLGEVARAGRTVLFVSHNLVAVERLCTRAIRLEKGQMIDDGNPTEVVASYLAGGFAPVTESIWETQMDAPGNEMVRLRRVAVYDETAQPGEPFTVRSPLTFDFEYWNFEPGLQLNLSLHLLNEQELTVFNTFPVHEPVWHGKPFPAGLFRSRVTVPGDLLNNGTYRVLLLIVRDQGTIIHRQEEALVFDVHDSASARNEYHGQWHGVVRPILDWTTELVENQVPV
ncbi:MAG: ATP-binding cassette domain-containing protein [bacterium]|nr:ATP-binding cassette domain-containing protein [Candidatus Kapabacteria bacterium]